MVWRAQRTDVHEVFNPGDPAQLQRRLDDLQMYILARSVTVFYELVGYSMDQEDASYTFAGVRVILRNGKLHAEFRLKIPAPPPPEVATYDLETGIFDDHQLGQNCPERFVATIALAYVASRCYPERVVTFKMNGDVFEAENGEIWPKVA